MRSMYPLRGSAELGEADNPVAGVIVFVELDLVQAERPDVDVEEHLGQVALVAAAASGRSRPESGPRSNSSTGYLGWPGFPVERRRTTECCLA